MNYWSNYWLLVWTISLLVAGASFAIITLVVTIRGFKDLRAMFNRLRQQQREQ